MSTLFPKATRATGGRPTYVLLDMDDYSIPDDVSPYLIKKKMRTALYDANYRSDPSYLFCLADIPWPEDRLSRFQNSGIYIDTEEYEGCRDLRLRKMLLNVVFWVWSWDTLNVLLLSKHHKTMEQDPTFIRFRKTVENSGCCLVLANPETFINDCITEE